jgi:hypothetical protein
MPWPKVLARQQLASADPLDLFRPGAAPTARRGTARFAAASDFHKSDLSLMVRYVERRALRRRRRRHECAFKRAERKARAVHQFGQHLGNVLRLARRDRYAMDHLNASVAKCLNNRCSLS